MHHVSHMSLGASRPRPARCARAASRRRARKRPRPPPREGLAVYLSREERGWWWERKEEDGEEELGDAWTPEWLRVVRWMSFVRSLALVSA